MHDVSTCNAAVKCDANARKLGFHNNNETLRMRKAVEGLLWASQIPMRSNDSAIRTGGGMMMSLHILP